jgi:CRISPR-associated protein Cas1
LRKKQYSYDGLEIARLLVLNKISQQINTLKKIRDKNKSLDTSLEKLITYKQKLISHDQFDLNDILGIEGIASKTYFSEMFNVIDWKGRKPRVKHDMVNFLLDLGYTLLFNFIESLLNLYGFDVYKGVYHQEFYQRKSLVCDLVEPFRTLIDYRIRKAFTLGQVKEDDFYITHGQYTLKNNKSPEYSQWLLQELLDNKDEIFLFIQSYYRSFIRSKSFEEYPVFKTC